MAKMRISIFVCGTLLLIYATSSVSCLTNAEFFDLIKDYITEDTESDDVGDDVIDLPGGPNENVNIERLLNQLGDSFEEINGKSTLENIEQHPLSWVGCECRRSYCQCCITKRFRFRLYRRRYSFGFNACAKAEYRRRGFEISFILNGRRVLHRRYSLRRGISFCYRLKYFPLAKICLNLYNINLRRHSLCTRVTASVHVLIRKFQVHLKLGCFRFGDYNDDNKKVFESYFDQFLMGDDTPLRYTDFPSQLKHPQLVNDAIDEQNSQDRLDAQDASTDDLDSYNEVDLSDTSLFSLE